MNASLRQLRYFLVVADELSFTRAAERLHVAQPAVSAQIRELEREIGVTLLERTTRRVELTEAGRALAEDTRRLLDGLDAAWARARRVGEGRSGLQVSADQVWAIEAEAAVLSGDADLALERLPSPHEDLSEHVLRQERLAVFASHDNALAARPDVSIGDLHDQVILTVPRDLAAGFHDLVADLCRRAGFEPRLLDVTAPSHREPLLSHLARHPDQVFVGPVSIATMPWPGVAHVPIRDADAQMPLSIIVRRGELPAHVAFALDAARAVAEREGWLPLI